MWLLLGPFWFAAATVTGIVIAIRKSDNAGKPDRRERERQD